MCKHPKIFSTIYQSNWYFVVDSQIGQKFRSDYFSDLKKN